MIDDERLEVARQELNAIIHLLENQHECISGKEKTIHDLAVTARRHLSIFYRENKEGIRITDI